VPFLECFASWKTWLLLVMLFALDYVNLLFPLYNPTAIQQGQMAWAGTHPDDGNDMATLLGYTATKLELALQPAIICAAGPMMLGDHDTQMEVFLFQLAVFVGPVVLSKMGYGFAVNTSTLLVVFQALVVLVRYIWRRVVTPDLPVTTIHAADETMEEVLSGSIPMHLVLGGSIPNLAVEVDGIHGIRANIAGPGGDLQAVPATENMKANQEKEDDDMHTARNTVAAAKWKREVMAIVEDLFPRYDLDNSGTINVTEEAEMLLMNSVATLKLKIGIDALDCKLDLLRAMDLEQNALDSAQFAEWLQAELAEYSIEMCPR